MEDGKTSELFNIPVNVQDKVSKNLHLTHAHPLATIKILIQDYFQNEWAPQNGILFLYCLQESGIRRESIFHLFNLV